MVDFSRLDQLNTLKLRIKRLEDVARQHAGNNDVSLSATKFTVDSEHCGVEVFNALRTEYVKQCAVLLESYKATFASL